MKHNVKILFTSVGRRVELVQQFKMTAARMGVNLTVIGADISKTAPALAFCDKTVIVPRISNPDYIPALLDICQKLGVDGLIPTIDTDLYLLSKSKAEFAAIGTQVFISAPEKISICRDKRFTSDYFHSLGLASPASVDDVDKYDGGFPAFIKPFDGSSSIGANKAENLEELKFFASRLSQYVIQPFAGGVEYTVDVFGDTDGNPVYITPRIRQAVRAGEVLKTKVCHQEKIVEEILRLVKDFKPCGPITVQLIRNEETDTNHYIEINPRFGGGAPLTMKAGADAAEALIKLLMGEKLTYMPKAAKEGAVFSRFDQSICVEHAAASDIKAVIFDLDDTLYSEKEYVKSGYAKVAEVLSQAKDVQQRLWKAFEDKKPAIDCILQEEGITDEETKQKCLAAYRNQMPDIHLYEGVRELLLKLREKGIKIGIITDGRPEGQRAKLKALGLYELADSVLITDELGGTQFRKPNDIAFRILQGRFLVPYDSMIYVGDNVTKDFQAPKALGMRYLHFYNEDGLYVTESFEEGCVRSIDEMSSVLLLK